MTSSPRLPVVGLSLSLCLAAAICPSLSAGRSVPLGVPDEVASEVGEPISAEEFALSANVTAEKLDEGSPNPILAAGLFEGDIADVSPDDFLSDGNAFQDGFTRQWEGGVVPYVISAAFTDQERLVVAAAMQEMHELTCVRFVPRVDQPDFIYLRHGKGCSSGLGRRGGGQNVILDYGCFQKGLVQHELMHALGFWHEQSRPDRDNYVTVLFENIEQGQEHNFMKYPQWMSYGLGLPYDTGSMMHYQRNAFSRNGYDTIVPKNPTTVIGPQGFLTKVDVEKVNRLYGCRNVPVPPPNTPTPTICTDTDFLCNHLASLGLCRQEAYWMRYRCAFSCGFCGAAGL